MRWVQEAHVGVHTRLRQEEAGEEELVCSAS